MNLTYNDERHEYRIDGVVVPSVTQVLKVLTGDYLARLDPAVVERKRQIGTAVSAAIALDVYGDLVEGSVDPQCEGFFAGWRAFWRDGGFTLADVLEPEKPLGHPTYRYAGKRDLPIRIGGRWAMVDTKCTALLHPAVGPQTAAYAELHNGTCRPGDIRIEDRYALHLKPDGKYRLEPLKDPADFQTFLSALNCKRWQQRYLKEPLTEATA